MNTKKKASPQEGGGTHPLHPPPRSTPASRVLEAAETPIAKGAQLHRSEERKIGGEKAPTSPSEVSKLVADVIPASVNPLEQEFETMQEKNLI